MFSVSVVVLLTGLAVAPPPAYSRADDAIIRRAVYGEGVETAWCYKQHRAILVIPKAVRNLYKKHPEGVLATLRKIVDGASPGDSILALGFALELRDGPGAGLFCLVPLRKPNAYDAYDKDLKKTPREFWSAMVRLKPKK
jgi:hypothetical protein